LSTKDILRPLWNPKVHYRVHKSPPTGPRPEPHAFSPHRHILFKFHFNIIFVSTTKSSTRSRPVLSTINAYCCLSICRYGAGMLRVICYLRNYKLALIVCEAMHLNFRTLFSHVRITKQHSSAYIWASFVEVSHEKRDAFFLTSVISKCSLLFDVFSTRTAGARFLGRHS